MIAKNKITRFGLIRHAETVWNRGKKIQGQTDSPLTRRGISQAEKWGRVLNEIKWDRIITSDIGRAIETAGRINRKLQVAIYSDPGLREQDWGQWTGKTLNEIEQEDPQFFAAQIRAGWMFCPPQGETRLNLWERGHQALVSMAARRPGETILVVTHEGIIKSLIYRLSGRKFTGSEPPMIKSFHLHWLIHNGQALKLEKLNAMSLG
ncbi:MAG: histidine phosphatase family protein [Desulfobacterales bacterium]|jgi:probable phosphoglycerate mutase